MTGFLARPLRSDQIEGTMITIDDVEAKVSRMKEKSMGSIISTGAVVVETRPRYQILSLPPRAKDWFSCAGILRRVALCESGFSRRVTNPGEHA